MSYSYTCAESAIAPLWYFKVEADENSEIPALNTYYILAHNTTNDTYSVWCYYDGNYGGIVSQHIWRTMSGVEQEFSQSLTAEYQSEYDVTLVRPYDISASPITMPPTMQTIEGTTAELNNVLLHQAKAAEARAYFDIPTAPCMDVEIYTSNAGRMVTVKWDNIQNMYSGSAESDYRVAIDGYGVMCPYTDKEFQVSYQGWLNALPDAIRQQAVIDGYFTAYIKLGYDDPDDGWTLCSLYQYKVFPNGDIQDETDPDTGGSSTYYINESPNYNNTYNIDGGDEGTQAPGQAMSIDNLLTTSYAVSEAQLIAFGQYMWNNDLQPIMFANQTCPMENVLSCKRIPFDVTGSDQEIYLGNVHTGVHGNKTSSTHIQSVGSVTMPTLNGNFLDYLSNVSIYLPYCGIHSIPTSLLYKEGEQTITLKDGSTFKIPKLVGKTISVKYIYDIIFGTCAAVVSIGGNEMFIFNGNCGIDIPITSSNRAEVELGLQRSGANTVIGGVTSIGSAILSGFASGGAVGALAGAVGASVGVAGNVAKEAVNQFTSERHYSTSGGFSSQVASYLSSSVMLFIEYIVYEKPKAGEEDVYGHENGYPCYLALDMSTLEGYTELDGAIEISGIPCLDEERVLLKQALQEGFYL